MSTISFITAQPSKLICTVTRYLLHYLNAATNLMHTLHRRTVAHKYNLFDHCANPRCYCATTRSHVMCVCVSVCHYMSLCLSASVSVRLCPSVSVWAGISSFTCVRVGVGVRVDVRARVCKHVCERCYQLYSKIVNSHWYRVHDTQESNLHFVCVIDLKLFRLIDAPVCVWKCIHIYINKWVCIRVYIYVYMCIYTYIYVYVYVYVYKCIYTYICMHIYIYINKIFMHMYTYTRI